MSEKTLALAPARTVSGTILWAIALSLVLVASARIQVPFWPVPMTLQTLAVLAIAGLAGPRLAWAALVAYLLEGAVGLPVFAGTPERGIGLAYMAGPTGGYMLGWFFAVALAGWAGRRFASRPVPLVACMVAAAALVYLPGVAWLATFIGWSRAVVAGAVPFLLADLVKAALAAALVLAAAGWRRRV